MKTEFHCHTNRSFDCEVMIEDRIHKYKELGFDKLYITDHDKNTPLRWTRFSDTSLEICSGIEISTYYGHIIVLDSRYVPPITALWAIALWSKFSNAKIYIPHPCRPGTGFFKRCEERKPISKYIQWFLSKVDIIEVWNPRDSNRERIQINESWLNEIKSCTYAIASDSHFNNDILESGCDLKGIPSHNKYVKNFFNEKFLISNRNNISLYHFLRSGVYTFAYLLGYRPQ